MNDMINFYVGYALSEITDLPDAAPSMEKIKRDQLIPILEQWLQLLENSLACRSGMPAVSPEARNIGARRSPKDLMCAIDALLKAIEYAQGNISPGAICGWLSWELR